jgi:hypothetical protein
MSRSPAIIGVRHAIQTGSVEPDADAAAILAIRSPPRPRLNPPVLNLHRPRRLCLHRHDGHQSRYQQHARHVPLLVATRRTCTAYLSSLPT